MAAEQEARAKTLSEQITHQPEKFRMEQRGQSSDVLNPLNQDLRKQLDSARADLAGLHARRESLRTTIAALDASLARDQARRASVQARRHALEGEYQVAERRYTTLASRATDTSVAIAARHEDLQIADQGIVPTRPVSPRPSLNSLLAAFFGLIAAILYETWIWNAGRLGTGSPRDSQPVTIAEHSTYRR
jgi:uncharacterized protein involved in exopolysaccharide biosynthesis